MFIIPTPPTMSDIPAIEANIKVRIPVIDPKMERACLEEFTVKSASLRSEILCEKGYETYIAGGAVRDMYMGEVVHDIDIATQAKPDEVQKLFQTSHAHGKSFGVVVVRENDLDFEIATFRKDFGSNDHRRPAKVEFTSSKEDALRRDFTINGLFYDPIKEKIIDYIGGTNDIEKKTIRFIGNPEERINEDYLRMLRAVRFTNRFEFTLEKESFEAIKNNDKKVQEISVERVRDEVSKMLINKNRRKAIEMLSELDLLKYILPELEEMKGIEQPPEFHSEGDVWRHTMLALEKLPRDPSEVLCWTVLLHDIAKPQTQGFRNHPKSKITFFEHDVESAKKAGEILERFKFSHEFINQVTWVIAQHMRIINAFREGDQQMSERKQEKIFLDPRIEILLESTRADLSASVRKDGSVDLTMYQNALKRKNEFMTRPKEEKEQVKKFSLITGKDIIKELNLEPGPKIGKIKSEIEKAFLDGKISTREEAFKMLKGLK